MAETIAYPFASNLLSKLGECLFVPIGRQFGYVLCYKSNVEDLENAVNELKTAHERVEHSVNEAVHNGKPIHEDVKNWLKSVKEETEKADYLLNRNKSAKDACFRGWLPNPVVRYPIGGKVKKMTQVIQGHHDKSKNSIFEKVFYENTPIGIVTTATSVARSAHRKEDVLESRASITEDVIKAITDDKVCVIGVYGPGGVGKSKLMEDIERQVKEEQLFDVVATTNVSRNPDLKRIQGEIAYALGLKLVNEETAFGRADLLCKKLEEYSKKKILIILDNLWAKLELKDVGIPCGYDNKVRGCKLLLTSRYRGDLYTEMGSDQEFQLSLLGHGEARMLFERTVGDRVNGPQFESFVDRVVRNCGGLPLLIVSLAKRLKRGDLPEWRNALTNMGGSSVKSMVELNYNDLEDERIKFLFLVRALRSGRDSVRDTLVTCMGLGLYKKFSETIENARDRLIMDLRCLLSCSLLLGSDNVEKLSMHDLFVDVAISMHDKFIDTEWNALVGRKDFGFEEWSKYDLRKCTAMVFDNVGIDELPKKLDCPNMRILLLSEHNWSLKFPESFFESMEKLQVLDLTGFAFTSLPSSMGFLENLKSLCLDQCHLEDVTALGKLKGLQFLGFFDSTIARLPKEMGELIKLRFLDLTGCTMLKVIEPGVLESLVNLEELYMQNSFDQWEAEDKTPRSNASLAEFKNMKRLSTLHIAIPRSATLSRDLPFGKLNKYEILIGDVWDWSYEYKESRTLKLKLDSGNLLHEEWVQRCLQRTQVLHLMGLQDNHSIHDLCFKGFRELKHLHVQNSPSLHYVVHSTKDIRCTAFMRLESLFLENLNNLEKICCGRLALESFSKLKIVKLDNCGEIKCLFPSSMMRIFLQLEDIKISRCRLIKQIVADAEADEDGDEIDVDPKVKSCNLHRLTLQNLPEMTSFCKIMDHSVVLFNIQQVEFPNMESIEISHMNKVEKIWFDGLASNAFSKLKTLVVEHCEKLSSIFSSYTMLTRFQTLEEITVTGCGSLEVVFHIQEFNFSEARCTSTFQLRELILMRLSKLKHVWSGHPQGGLTFGCLRHMEIVQCERLKSLFPSLVAESMTQLEQLSVNSCGVEEIIAEEDRGAGSSEGGGRFFPRLTQLTLIKLPELRSFYKNNHTSTWPLLLALFSVEKVGFPAIESMEISQIPNVEKIWVDELASDAFSKLKTLRVDLCEKLASIFSSDIILTRLRKLEELTVTNCGSLEVVFQIEEINMSRAHNTSSFRLRQLNLERLPKIKHMWSGHPNGTLKFESLQCLKATECESLQSLFPNSVAKCMTQLEQLLVSSCGVEEIIAEEDGADVSANDLFFPQLTDLRLLGLPNLRSFYRNSHTSTWPILKQLRVRHCGKMRSFSFAGLIESCHGSTTSDQRTLFSFEKVITNLKGLTLTREDIMMMMQQHYIFGNLEELELACYHDENVVFPSDFLLHRFPHLEVLSLSCSSFEEIFPEDVFGHGGATPYGELTDVETPLKALGNLKLLELNKLCKLQRVWKDGSLMAEILKHIRFLLISECSSLSIVLPSLTAFQRLTKLEVKGCTGLVHMGTCSAMQSLVHLTRLILRDCGKMEDMVTYDGNEIEEVSFPKLEELILDGLPSLESFSSTNCAFRFPLLWQITVKLCANMNIFCNGALNTPILHKVCLFDKDYKGRWEGDLNTTIQSLST